MSKPRAVRAIPAVEKVLQALGPTSLPRPFVVALVRRNLAQLRAAGDVPPLAKIVAQIRGGLDDLARSRLQPVINGTGIIIHTNFGRAPLSPAAMRAVAEIGSSYNNLEYDLTTGARGKRAGYLEEALALLCSSEAATVVNNCAAALCLIVRHFTSKKPEVIISRGELVQIGGGFRIGEILEASGARLREVGATNKTVLSDYAKAIGPETGLILKVHQSNFFMSGFAGALLLLYTPASVFSALVPWLLGFATLVFALGNFLPKPSGEPLLGPAAIAGLQVPISIYGGYFGGGVGILMLAAMTFYGSRDIRLMNVVKLILVGLSNTAAVVTFAAAGTVVWPQALVMMVAAVAGGYAGGKLAGVIDPKIIKGFIIVTGVVLTLAFALKG